MKKYMIILFTMILTVSSVQAATFPNQLPGGKNYINPENLTTTGDVVTTIEHILVNPSTEYTISFPGNVLLYDHEILIETEGTQIFDDMFSNASDCFVSDEYASCTFTTPSDTTHISFSFTAMGVGQFVSNFDYQDFQLETGSAKTVFEPYVEPLSDSNNPTFSGSGAFIVSYFDEISLDDILGTHIMAIDDIDGDISDQIMIESDEYTANMTTVGSYLVEMFVTDNAGNTTTFNLTMIVKDEVAPLIVGPDEIEINIDNIKMINDIIAEYYTGVDGYDSLVPVILKTDGYTENTDTIGTYQVELEAEDSSSNSILRVIEVNIVDTSLPQMTGNNNLSVYLSNPKDVTTLLSELIIYDNYDEYEDLVITPINDTYTGNEDTLGNYYVDFLVEDTSNNVANFRMNLEVKDDIKPEISGPESLQLSYIDTMPLDDIINLYTVSDNYDSLQNSDISIESNEYHNRTEPIGEFDIVLSIFDESNNKSSITLTITVIDDQGPVIYIDDYIVNVSTSSSFSPRDALLMMINNKEIPNGDYDVETLLDEYSGNEEVPGTYSYKVLIKDSEGKEITKDLMIKVTNPEQNDFDANLIIRNLVSYSIVSIVVILSIIKYRKITD